MILYGYWRSSAAYRVRIALNLKGIQVDHRAVNLSVGEQSGLDFKSINPHGTVPFLIDGDIRVGQSLAIINYLDRVYPAERLMPTEPALRARVEEVSLAIACDIHPLNNLKVLNYLKTTLAQTQRQVDHWYRHWIISGLVSIETVVPDTGPHLFGHDVTVADVCLVPQIYNARRFNIDLTAFPKLLAADRALRALPAFMDAEPERQLDAPQ